MKSHTQLMQDILSKTKNKYLKTFIKECITATQEEIMQDEKINYFYRAVDYILHDAYDVTGFGLYEIPVRGTFCFFHEDGREFDIDVDEDMITAGYVGMDYQTSSIRIEEAIKMNMLD